MLTSAALRFPARVIPIELILQWLVFVNFVPKRNQARFKKVAKMFQAMYASVASGAQRDQKSRVVEARTAVMYGEFLLRPTGGAAMPVTRKNLVAIAGKAAAGVRLPKVAGPAEAGAK